MRKKLNLVFYSLVGLLYTFKINAESMFGEDRVNEVIQNDGINLIPRVDGLLGYVLGLLYFISVIIGVYAGFRILTAAGDEEKVKKGKTTLIYVILGLMVIFLTSQFVTWINTVMTDPNIVGS